MKIKEIIKAIENIAPLCYQENYDNSGLQIGDREKETNSILVCLDITESVIDEAVALKCDMVISHHPLIFSGVKQITGNTYIERIIVKAISNNIAIYSAHTSLDNVYDGVNSIIAKKIGLKNLKILEPKSSLLYKLNVFVPSTHIEIVKRALFEAGAGEIGNYDNCSFSSSGKGTFRANENANPFVGDLGKIHTESEFKLEVIVPVNILNHVISKMKEVHPYEEVAYDLFKLENKYSNVGSGMYGELDKEMSREEFASYLKEIFSLDVLKCSFSNDKIIKRVAICGGSGSFLIGKALGVSADCFITGEIKYHDYLDYNEKISLFELGHYESEKFTISLIQKLLSDKFQDLKINITNINTNPIKYI